MKSNWFTPSFSLEKKWKKTKDNQHAIRKEAKVPAARGVYEALTQGTKFAAITGMRVEAAIASVHARARRAENTDCRAIISLHDTLVSIRPTPVVAVKRAIAIAQSEGPDRGLEDRRDL